MSVSGFNLSGLSNPLYLYSWTEQYVNVTSGSAGQWTPIYSPRVGSNNAREINNTSLSGQFPFYARLHYEGNVSGQPFYSFTYPSASPDYLGVTFQFSGAFVTAVSCAGGVLNVTTANLYLSFISGILQSGHFG